MENKAVQLNRIKESAAKNKLLIITIVLFVFCSLYNPSFLSRLNINGMMLSTSYMSLLVIGMTFVILTGGIDLSVGATAGLSSVILAYGMNNFMIANESITLLFCILLVLIVSVGIGLINGLFVAMLNLPPLVVTLGMTWVVTGIADTIVKGKPIPLPKTALKTFLKFKVFNVVPVMLIISVVALVLFIFIFAKLRYGRQFYAVGSSKYAAYVSGMNIRAVLINAYSVAGLLSGIAGIFIAINLNAGYPKAANGYELYTIAAAVMGGVALEGGQGKLLNAFYGVLILQILKKLVVFTGLANISGFLEGMIVGTILVLVLYFNSLKSKGNSYE